MPARKLRLFNSVAPAALTIAEICEAYLRHAEAEGLHCPDARRRVVRTLSAFSDAGGDMLASDVKAWNLLEWIESHPGWKSPSTRRAAAGCIKACFAWAAKTERIGRDPFQAVRFKENERRPDMPDMALQKLARAANKRFEQALWFLRYTGCRTGELCRAQWPDLDLERGVWVIDKHKTRKSTGRPKVVALVPEAVELLREIGPQEAGRVFLNSRGTAWTHTTLGTHLRRLKARHGVITKASLHGIRHRMASAAIAAGAPIKMVAEQLGHATTQTTERFYWHASEQTVDAMREAASRGLPK